MVEVVLQEVIFGKIRDVAGLYAGEEMDVRGIGREGDNVDHLRECWISNW
jgi:hypothetical protein